MQSVNDGSSAFECMFQNTFELEYWRFFFGHERLRYWSYKHKIEIKHVECTVFIECGRKY